MDPISKFFLAVIEDLVVVTVVFFVWHLLLHWVHDTLRGIAKRNDATFMILPVVLGGGLAGTAFSMYLYYGFKKALTGGYFTPWILG